MSSGALDKKSRLAAQASKSQAEVWSKVGEANLSLANSSYSGAFTGNYVQADIVKKLEPYQKQIEQPILGREHVVGVIVAIDGKLEMADIFESTPLFRKLWPKLLKSYALDAAQVTKAAAAEKSCSVADAKALLDGILQAKVGKTETAGGLLISTRTTSRFASFSANEKSADSKPSVADFSRAVHSSVFTK